MICDSLPATFSDRVLASRLVTPAQLAAGREAAGDDDRQLALHLVRIGLLTPFQARQIRAGAVSFHVGKYIVIDRLGRGGTSIVFKARHCRVAGQTVALKTLNTESLHHGDDALARFRREIDIVTRLDHPNIVRALDVVETRTQLYLVLEYISGRDLASLVRERGPMPVTEAVGCAVQAARGLAHAHAHGIIHRDVKPANLLRARDGTVKLSDLGLARLLTSDADLTLKGMCMGTPEFMAPEQAEDACRADARSDLYGLGATLFHLLTAQLPVNGSSYLHCLQKLLTAAPRPLLDARPDVPAELAAVVDRLRERDPAERPASAEEAIRLLEPFARPPAADDVARWDGKRKAALVLEVLQGRAAAADVCTRHGLTVAEFERWRRRFVEAAEQALGAAGDSVAVSPETLRDLHARIGAQAVEIESMKKRLAARNDRGSVLA